MADLYRVLHKDYPVEIMQQNRNHIVNALQLPDEQTTVPMNNADDSSFAVENFTLPKVPPVKPPALELDDTAIIAGLDLIYRQQVKDLDQFYEEIPVNFVYNSLKTDVTLSETNNIFPETVVDTILNEMVETFTTSVEGKDLLLVNEAMSANRKNFVDFSNEVSKKFPSLIVQEPSAPIFVEAFINNVFVLGLTSGTCAFLERYSENFKSVYILANRNKHLATISTTKIKGYGEFYSWKAPTYEILIPHTSMLSIVPSEEFSSKELMLTRKFECLDFPDITLNKYFKLHCFVPYNNNDVGEQNKLWNVSVDLRLDKPFLDKSFFNFHPLTPLRDVQKVFRDNVDLCELPLGEICYLVLNQTGVYLYSIEKPIGNRNDDLHAYQWSSRKFKLQVPYDLHLHAMLGKAPNKNLSFLVVKKHYEIVLVDVFSSREFYQTMSLKFKNNVAVANYLRKLLNVDVTLAKHYSLPEFYAMHFNVQKQHPSRKYTVDNSKVKQKRYCFLQFDGNKGGYKVINPSKGFYTEVMRRPDTSFWVGYNQFSSPSDQHYIKKGNDAIFVLDKNPTGKHKVIEMGFLEGYCYMEPAYLEPEMIKKLRKKYTLGNIKVKAFFATFTAIRDNLHWFFPSSEFFDLHAKKILPERISYGNLIEIIFKEPHKYFATQINLLETNKTTVVNCDDLDFYKQKILTIIRFLQKKLVSFNNFKEIMFLLNNTRFNAQHLSTPLKNAYNAILDQVKFVENCVFNKPVFPKRENGTLDVRSKKRKDPEKIDPYPYSLFNEKVKIVRNQIIDHRQIVQNYNLDMNQYNILLDCIKDKIMYWGNGNYFLFPRTNIDGMDFGDLIIPVDCDVTNRYNIQRLINSHIVYFETFNFREYAEGRKGKPSKQKFNKRRKQN